MSDLIERAELIDKNMAQAKEIERLTEIKDLAVKDCMAEAAENEYLQARVEELEGVLMTESEKRDLLSKEHYRNKVEIHFNSYKKLQAKVEALEAARSNWYCEMCGCHRCLEAEAATEEK